MVEEDDVDRGRFLLASGSPDTARSTTACTSSRVQSTNSCRSFATVSGGPLVIRTTDRLPTGVPSLQATTRRTEEVNPVFEVVVLGFDVDADEVRVQFRRGHGQGAVALAGDVAEGLGAVLAHGAAEAPGPVDQFIEPGADRPGGGDLLDLGLPARCGDEVGLAAGGEVLERGEGTGWW